MRRWRRRRLRRAGLWLAGIGALAVGLERRALANGQAEYVAPLDRPVSAVPGRPLPYPVVEEAAARGVPSVLLEPLPPDIGYVTTRALSTGVAHDNALGEKRRCFESVVLRSSEIAPGRVAIPAGALGYVSEDASGALPFRGDALCLAGKPRVLVDFEQTIVTRKNVTLSASDTALLGSELFRLRSITELGDARSAVVEVSALSGFDWGRLGSGSLELSTSEPGWHARTFHYGLHQGRVEQVTPKEVRLAWLSGLRTDAVVLADRRELGGPVTQGTEQALSDGGRVRVLRVDAAQRLVELDTPDGRKTLGPTGDVRGLPADSAARKRLIAVAAGHAYVLVPEASDFAARKPQLEIYSGLRQFRHGELAPEARAYKVYAYAHYNGAVHGLYWVNDQPLELTPQNPKLEGPFGSFELRSTWSADGRLESLELVDHERGRSGPVPVAGRKSVAFLAGAGPSIESLLARGGLSALAELAVPRGQPETAAPAPSSSAAARRSAGQPATADPLSLSLIRPALFWICAATALGLLIGFGLGRAR